MTELKLWQVETMSRMTFLQRGVEAIITDDVPALIDWAEAAPEAEIVSQIVEGLGDTPVALFKKSADPATKSRSEVVKIRLTEFFTNETYRTTDDGLVHRVVTNIKNNPGLIDTLLGEAALPFFDHTGKSHYINL